MKSSLFIIAASVCVFGLSGCETQEDRTLAGAQACLDNAHTESAANTCIDMVANLSSQEASLIRCSAHFIAQGFTASRLSSAFSNINSGAAGSGTTTLMAYMVFDDLLTRHTAAITQTDCDQSGVVGMVQLGEAVAAATKIRNFGGVAIDPADPVGSIKTNIQNMIDDATNAGSNTPDEAEIGDLAVTLETSFCSGSSSYGTTDICTSLQTAINTGAGDNAAIGAALLNLIKN